MAAKTFALAHLKSFSFCSFFSSLRLLPRVFPTPRLHKSFSSCLSSLCFDHHRAHSDHLLYTSYIPRTFSARCYHKLLPPPLHKKGCETNCGGFLYSLSLSLCNHKTCLLCGWIHLRYRLYFPSTTIRLFPLVPPCATHPRIALRLLSAARYRSTLLRSFLHLGHTATAEHFLSFIPCPNPSSKPFIRFFMLAVSLSHTPIMSVCLCRAFVVHNDQRINATCVCVSASATFLLWIFLRHYHHSHPVFAGPSSDRTPCMRHTKHLISPHRRSLQDFDYLVRNV